MLYRSLCKCRRILTQFFSKNSCTIQNKFRTIALSLFPVWWHLDSWRIVCAQRQSQLIDGILEKVTVTMQELVKLLNDSSGQDFVIIVYNKFEKTNHPEAFGLQLKAVLQQCKYANVTKVYAITSKDEQYLRQIERRVKSQPLESNTQSNSKNYTQSNNKKKQVIDCYYKSKVYSQAFQLVNTKEYSISEQIKQIQHFEITTNSGTLNAQILALYSLPFNVNKNIVVKQCRGKGECVDSFKHSVKKLIDSGLLIRKTQQYQFELVIDQPSGLLSKPSEYIKNFESYASKVTNRHLKHRKEETYVFGRDILGKEVRLMSEWAQKEENNYDDQSLLMMFIRPRVNIIGKLNTLTDLQWYFLTNRLSRAVSLSLNNTDKWKKTNRKQSLQVLKMLQNYYPQLNLLIINSTAAGDIINHVHADHKYVIFSESSDPIWNKKFMDLDQLQKLEGREQIERVFKEKYKQQLDAFIKMPQVQDYVVVEKEQEISLQRLKQWKQQHLNGHKIVRVCHQRCLRFLNQRILHQLQEKLNQKLNVYWIDNQAQNVGVKAGDYLLKDGKLYDIAQLLAS